MFIVIRNLILPKVLACCCLLVVAMRATASVSTGSGVFVNSNILLTAYHVVDGASKIIVTVSDGRMANGRVLDFDKKKDWALVETDLSVSCFALADPNGSNVSMGDKIYVLGFPAASVLGQNVKYTEGVISAVGFAGDDDVLQMTAPVQPGNSGGPVFDCNGKLRGIVSASIDPKKFFTLTGGALPQGLNFALSISALTSKIEALGVSSVNYAQCSIERNRCAVCFIKCETKGRDEVQGVRQDSPLPVLPSQTSPKREPAPTLNLGEGVVPIEGLFGIKLGEVVGGIPEQNCGISYCTKSVPVPEGIEDFKQLMLYCTPISHKIYKIVASVRIAGEYAYERKSLFEKYPSQDKVERVAEKYKKLYEEKYGIFFKLMGSPVDSGWVEPDGNSYRYCDVLPSLSPQRYQYLSYPDFNKSKSKTIEHRFTIVATCMKVQKVPKSLAKSRDMTFNRYIAQEKGYRPELECEVSLTLFGKKEDAIRAQEEFVLQKPERDKEAERKKRAEAKQKKYQELL